MFFGASRGRWWVCSKQGGFVFFLGNGLILWWLIPFAILWSVWKERKNRIFKGSLLYVDDLSQLVVIQIAKWASFKKEFDNLRVDSVLHNWDASLSCGVKRVKMWCIGFLPL